MASHILNRSLVARARFALATKCEDPLATSLYDKLSAVPVNTVLTTAHIPELESLNRAISTFVAQPAYVANELFQSLQKDIEHVIRAISA